MISTTILLATLGGVLPALLWLFFWTREDTLHPEPKRLLLLTFIAGGITVAFAIFFQKIARDILGADITAPLIIAWAFIEEALKYLVALAVVLWRRAVDEPIDTMIYMLTIALGFAAVENSLFLLSSLQAAAQSGDIVNSIVTTNFRFFGATLLHLLSSSLVGVFLALSFYKPFFTKVWYTVIGVILAIALHSAFNLFILSASGGNVIRVFAFVWIGIVLLFLFFEKIKRTQITEKYIKK